ncbi:MAG: Sec-independent protein translocase protein TatB [gamma proteobacterium symbiont of Taylorina sp.]|nr:Sec-independent protein translocase protein TatB [gamma proteobacterium symbiont of Taylorina sp.]
MFDIGFWELSLIGIVGLLVIGPERMPAVARTVGKWVGRANRFIANVKDDINKELKDEDLKKILEEQQKLADEFKAASNTMKSSIESETESIKKDVNMDDLLEIDELENEIDNEIKSVEKKSNRSEENSKPRETT